jgi:hypothetical protein
MSAAINTSHLKKIRQSGPLSLGMSVRCGLLSFISSLTSPSVKPGPFSDILQVCYELSHVAEMFKLLSETTLTVVTGYYIKYVL